MNIDQSFKAFKRDDLKVVYSLKLDNEEAFQTKRIITKIIKCQSKGIFWKFKDRKINKKHKGVRKDTQVMNFESYVMRINTIREVDNKKEEKKLYKKPYKLRIQI